MFKFQALIILLLCWTAPAWCKPTADFVSYNPQAGETPAPVAPSGKTKVLTLSVPVPDMPGCHWRIYYRIKKYNQPQILPPGAFLTYDMRCENPSASGGVELESLPRMYFMMRNAVKQGDIGNRRIADGWISRRVNLASCAGKPFQHALLGDEFLITKAGTYQVSYRNIRIEDSQGKIYWDLMPDTGALIPPTEYGSPEGSTVSMTDNVALSALPENFLYKTGSPVPIVLSVTGADPSAPVTAKITVNLCPVDGKKFQLSSLTCTLKPGENKTSRLDAGKLPAGNYRVETETVIGGSHGSQESPIFTVADHPLPQLTDNDVTAKKNIIWGSDCSFRGIRDYALLRESGGNYINLFVTWSLLEPKQGEYHFEQLDQAVRDIARANLRCSIFFANYYKGEFPPWTDKEYMQGIPGKKFQPSGHFSQPLSFWAPTARSAYLKFLRALVEHYKDNPTVIGYQPGYGGWGDSFYCPKPANDQTFYDYSEYSQAKFREYVRDVMKLDLKDASRRYELNLKSWNELIQPVPAAGMDLRPIWWDFQNYRLWSIEKMWDDVCGAVRNVDKDCLLIICYGGGQIGTGLNGNDYDVGCRTARKYNGIFHNTCYESPADGPAPLLYSYSRRWNFLHDCEFAGSPAFYPLHQRGMFNILKFGPAGYCWVTSYNDGIHPSFPCLRPVAQELETANAVGKSLGALQSMSLYLCNLGSIRWQPVLDGAVLASKLGLVPDILTDRAFLGEKVTLDPASSPIFVDYGASVLTAEAADAMAAYVRNGGKLLLFPSSGCYTAGNPGERFRLMKSLGFNTAEKLPQPGKVQNATGKNFHLLLSATVSLTEIPRHAKTLAAFPGGEPALVSWRCDRGEVFLMGGSPNLNDAGTLKSFEKWFAEIGLASRISTTNGIMSYAREKNGTLYAVVLNPTGECVTGRLSVKGAVYSRLVTNMIDGTCLGTKTISDLREGIPITLAPYETTAFRMTKPGTPSGEIYDYDYPHRSSNGETPHIVEGKLELPFEAGVDGAHTVFLSTDGTGETALSCSIDQKELKPMDGYPSIFRCPDIPRGRHVLTIEAPRRTVINEIRFQPELRPLGSWLITGPVANPDGYRGNSFYAASVPQNANWTKVEDHEGVLDFGAIYPFDARQLAFAKCEIGVPRDSVLRFDCGVDYSMLLYVNGESVFDSNQVHHSSDPSDFGLNIPLKKGDNTLLVKAGAGSMGWKVFLKAGFITEQKSTH